MVRLGSSEPHQMHVLNPRAARLGSISSLQDRVAHGIGLGSLICSYTSIIGGFRSRLSGSSCSSSSRELLP